MPDYARTELERRFLLERLPPGLDPDGYELFHDLFVAGTHVRFRRITRADGTWVANKLGQKIPDPKSPDDPRRRQMTTIYLPEHEGKPFDALPGIRAVKRRWRVMEGGHRFAVDLWQAPEGAKGTMLAEVEAASIEELEAIPVPSWAAREVTADPRYRSFALAST